MTLLGDNASKIDASYGVERILNGRKAMNDNIIILAEELRKAKRVIALTGAGISVESGIPAFRGNQGLWAKFDPMEYAHIDAFMQNPGKVWKMLIELSELVKAAKPNQAHYALARLESVCNFSAVITQNIDNLHQEAGSSHVVEFHGNSKRIKCLNCGDSYRQDMISTDILPPMCSCGGVLKPDIVFFGEMIPWRASIEAAAEAQACDLILVIGTSAVVAPASSIPITAKERGAKVMEINPEPTPLTDYVADISIHLSASEALSEVVRLLES